MKLIHVRDDGTLLAEITFGSVVSNQLNHLSHASGEPEYVGAWFLTNGSETSGRFVRIELATGTEV